MFDAFKSNAQESLFESLGFIHTIDSFAPASATLQNTFRSWVTFSRAQHIGASRLCFELVFWDNRLHALNRLTAPEVVLYRSAEALKMQCDCEWVVGVGRGEREGWSEG